MIKKESMRDENLAREMKNAEKNIQKCIKLYLTVWKIVKQ